MSCGGGAGRQAGRSRGESRGTTAVGVPGPDVDCSHSGVSPDDNHRANRVGCQSLTTRLVPAVPNREAVDWEPAVRSRGGAACHAPTGKETHVAEPIRVSGSIPGTDKILSFETGKFAPQSQGAVVASIGRTTVLATANAAKDVRDGCRLLPSHRRCRGAGLRGRQDPRLVLPSRGPAHRGRHPHLPADRPSAAPRLRRGLPQRDPGRDHGHRAPTRRTPTTCSPSTRHRRRSC